jgi:protein ImuB
MVGENKVGALELLDTHHPEGFRMRRFVAKVPRQNPREKMLGTEERATVTALRRFRPPRRASVTLENGQPTRLVCRNNMQGDVLWRAGPWRFSGDWWEREAWSRDEWDIALQNKAPRNGEDISFCRLVHDLLGGGWFVEGMYD